MSGAKGGPPYTVERVLGVGIMGAERDSDASARKTISILEDSNVHDVAKDKLIFFAADNAGNENKSADILRSVYTRMQCDFPDTTH